MGKGGREGETDGLREEGIEEGRDKKGNEGVKGTSPMRYSIIHYTSGESMHTYITGGEWVPVESECNFRLVIVEVMCADAGNGLHISAISFEHLSVVGDSLVQVVQSLRNNITSE